MQHVAIDDRPAGTPDHNSYALQNGFFIDCSDCHKLGFKNVRARKFWHGRFGFLSHDPARLAGRRSCPGCKAVFHIETRPPKAEGICDHCGGALYHREDDRPESIRVRMEAYAKSTAPLAEYYRNQGQLIPILAEGTPEAICQRTLQALKAKRA